jgi:hypothetical protein
MTLTSRLLRTSDLFPDESLPSGLARLAALNHYDSPNVLIRLCRLNQFGDEPALRPSCSTTFERITTLTEITPDRLYAGTVHRFAPLLNLPDHPPDQLTLPNGQVKPCFVPEKRSRAVRPDAVAQFCPDCLQAHPYHRLTWVLSAVSVCLLHHRLLVDCCPACHRFVSLPAVAIARCQHCRADLTQITSDVFPIDDLGQQSQQVIQHWFMDPLLSGTSLVNSLPPQPPAVLYYVMTQLGANLKRYSSGLPSLPTRCPAPQQSYLHYRMVFQALQDWPTGFYRLLQDSLDLARSKASEQRQLDQDAIYSEWLTPVWCLPGLEFVQEALEEYLIEHRSDLTNWRSPRRYRGQVGSAQRLSFMTINEASELLHISAALVWHLAQLGRITLVDEFPRRSYLDQLVRRSSVWAMRRSWQVTLPKRETAWWLGVSDEMLSDFVDAKLLAVDTLPLQGSPEQFSKQAIADLWSSLVGRVRSAFSVTSELLELDTAANLVKPTGQNATHLVDAVMQDQLPAYHLGPVLSAIDQVLFFQKDIQRYIV